MLDVLILDDDQSRVEWFKENYPKANITWHTVVSEFLKAYNDNPLLWELVIFDYDLTPDYATPYRDEKSGLWLVPSVSSDCLLDVDANGQNGLDAAKLLPRATMLTKNKKFLVWSANNTGAPMIKKVLEDRGYKYILQKSFDVFSNFALKKELDELMMIINI